MHKSLLICMYFCMLTITSWCMDAQKTREIVSGNVCIVPSYLLKKTPRKDILQWTVCTIHGDIQEAQDHVLYVPVRAWSSGMRMLEWAGHGHDKLNAFPTHLPYSWFKGISEGDVIGFYVQGKQFQAVKVELRCNQIDSFYSSHAPFQNCLKYMEASEKQRNGGEELQ